MAHAVEEGDDEIDPRPQHGAQPAEALDHIFLRLRHDPHAEENAEDDKGRQQQPDDVYAFDGGGELLGTHDGFLCDIACRYPCGRASGFVPDHKDACMEHKGSSPVSRGKAS